RHAVVEQPLQYLDVTKRPSLSPSARNRSDSYGGDATSLTAHRERSIPSKTHGERSIFSKRSLFGRCHRENRHKKKQTSQAQSFRPSAQQLRIWERSGLC